MKKTWVKVTDTAWILDGSEWAIQEETHCDPSIHASEVTEEDYYKSYFLYHHGKKVSCFHSSLAKAKQEQKNVLRKEASNGVD